MKCHSIAGVQGAGFLPRLALLVVLLVRPGYADDLINAFNQAQGLVNQAHAQGANMTAAQNQLSQARQQYLAWQAMQAAQARQNAQGLQTINPFGDYLFHGVPVRPTNGKLVTRSLDDWGKSQFAPMSTVPPPPAAASISQSPLSRSLGDLPVPSGSGNGGGKPLIPITAPPPPDVGDASVVDLRGSTSLTPQLLHDSTPAGRQPSGSSSVAIPPELLPSVEPTQHNSILADLSDAARDKVQTYLGDKLQGDVADKLGIGWVKDKFDDAKETYQQMTQQNNKLLDGTFDVAGRMASGQNVNADEADALLNRSAAGYQKMADDRIRATVKTGVSGGLESGNVDSGESAVPVVPINNVPEHPDAFRFPLRP